MPFPFFLRRCGMREVTEEELDKIAELCIEESKKMFKEELEKVSKEEPIVI